MQMGRASELVWSQAKISAKIDCDQHHFERVLDVISCVRDGYPYTNANITNGSNG